MAEDGLEIALERIAREAEEKTGILDLGYLGLTELPEELFALKHLRRVNFGMWSYDEGGNHSEAKSSIRRNSLRFERIGELPELRSVSLNATDFSTNTPLKGFERLKKLEKLYCTISRVRSLAPLEGLMSLQELNCDGAEIDDLAPLSGLMNLTTFNCEATAVIDLAPLKGVSKLKSLNCSRTKVSDLTPLTGIRSLESLDLLETLVSDLTPLEGLPNLSSLNCSQCVLTAIPGAFWLKPSLSWLCCHQTSIPGIPTEVLSQSGFENCLPSLRAHLRDLSAGEHAMRDVKLMVLGNGRVGKTQICRRLRNEPYDEAVESTHGIVVTSAPLPTIKDESPARLNIWDFGGQDIYHGTHALFMRSRAVFALVWFPGAETMPQYEHGGFVFRNQPLAYWLQYVRSFGGTDGPLLIVQTRCDRPEHDAVRPPVSDGALAPFPYRKLLNYSALNDRGRAALDDALREAVAWLHEKEGVAVIGVGRAEVKRTIEDMRDADAARPLAERRDRVMSFEQFEALCEKTGGVSDPKQLLAYLHNAGTVFYREGLFENRIIIDQGWALEAIYAVFNRQHSYGRILRQKGRFTRSDLADWVWKAEGYGPKEQELFISMMQSCGICFEYRPASKDGLIEAEYIAPDLLPGKPESEVAQKWDADRPTERAEFSYDLLPASLMRGIIAHIGHEAGLDADYWRDGLYVYEATTGSRGLIEQTTTGPWQGRISIQTQRGQAGLLLGRLGKLVQEQGNQLGVAPKARSRPDLSVEAARAKDPDKAAPPLQFRQERGPGQEVFISYAWGDDSEIGKRREQIVDKLCKAAEERGINILRDRKELDFGDSISKFMKRIGAGDRVFAVLSEKYLGSPYCMFELTEVWRNSQQDREKFLGRIRIITLPDAKIWTPLDRGRWGKYWREKRDELKEVVDDLGKQDLEQFWMMKNFSHSVGDILATLADIVQPHTDDEFINYGLKDLLGSDETLH
jgi:internalin A